MPTTAVVLVCLPPDTPTTELTATAIHRLTNTPHVGIDTVGHFTPRSRLRCWRPRTGLLPGDRGVTAGGPLRLLDLHTMQETARVAAATRWSVWNRVVAGTPTAQPSWVFSDRHHTDPKRYSRDRAHRDYLSQPRIAAMRTYNTLPEKVTVLPLGDLEAFQAGAGTYTNLGVLAAVPTDAMVTPDGGYLAPTSTRLADHLTYLEASHGQLRRLEGRDHLIAVATTLP
ncbi:MAG: hypothetical protein HYR62_02795 [Actinobacteria bacterium]|nr:hypothetical protein [Actinomycetota bacterium]MBI3687400.1 hypothetical protein [Actinomycetota bacterium]